MFGKVFNSLWDGSLASEPFEVWAVFVFLLAHCDSEGFVEMTADAISKRSGIPLDAVKHAIARLEAEDPMSRSNIMDGRRLEPIDDRGWGWRIVNHNHYRFMRDAEMRKAQNRDAQRKHRAKNGADSQQSQPRSAQAEAEAEAEKSLKSCGEPPCIELPTNRNGMAVPVSQAEVDEWSRLYPGVRVMDQLRAMRGWLLANPTKRKTAGGMKRFVNSWLSREQNRAPVFAPPEPQESPSRATALTRIEKDAQDALLNPEANGEAAKRAREEINRLVAGVGKGGK